MLHNRLSRANGRSARFFYQRAQSILEVMAKLS